MLTLCIIAVDLVTANLERFALKPLHACFNVFVRRNSHHTMVCVCSSAHCDLPVGFSLMLLHLQ